jgi:hypothetical protein
MTTAATAVPTTQLLPTNSPFTEAQALEIASKIQPRGTATLFPEVDKLLEKIELITKHFKASNGSRTFGTALTVSNQNASATSYRLLNLSRGRNHDDCPILEIAPLKAEQVCYVVKLLENLPSCLPFLSQPLIALIHDYAQDTLSELTTPINLWGEKATPKYTWHSLLSAGIHDGSSKFHWSTSASVLSQKMRWAERKAGIVLVPEMRDQTNLALQCDTETPSLHQAVIPHASESTQFRSRALNTVGGAFTALNKCLPSEALYSNWLTIPQPLDLATTESLTEERISASSFETLMVDVIPDGESGDDEVPYTKYTLAEQGRHTTLYIVAIGNSLNSAEKVHQLGRNLQTLVQPL